MRSSFETLFFHSPFGNTGFGNPQEIGKKERELQKAAATCLKGINVTLRCFGIPEASIANLTIPKVIIINDPLTAETFRELGIEEIPIIVLSNPDERQEGKIYVSIKDDLEDPEIVGTSINFDLSEHLPLLEESVSLITPVRDYRHDMAPHIYGEEYSGYFSFLPIPGKPDPFPGELFRDSVHIHFKESEQMDAIIVDARFPSVEKDVILLNASVSKDAFKNYKQCILHLKIREKHERFLLDINFYCFTC